MKVSSKKMLKQIFQFTIAEVVGAERYLHKEKFYDRYQSRTFNRNIKQRSEMGGTCVTLMIFLEMLYVNFKILKKKKRSHFDRTGCKW
jgi:hypothetical protein